jgi:exonuclease SbcD
MINLVRDLNPDVMVVAGDVFHHRRPDEEALALFHDTLNRLLGLGTIIVFLGGPFDDFKSLHLDARWVRDAGIYLFEDATQVLSPLTFRGSRDDFDIKAWCLPFPKLTQAENQAHPALFERSLVEKVVQRLDPSEVNLFLGYAWTQDSGRKEEFGSLVQPGGQPLERRLLDQFDLSALGGRHEPLAIESSKIYYSGSLLCYEPDAENPARSVAFYDIEAKNRFFAETYSLRPRRALKVLEGSWEELVEQGRQIRSDDLIVLRSQEKDLSAEQRADLRILAPNVVSVELPSPFEAPPTAAESSLPSIVETFQAFVRDVSGDELSEEAVELLVKMESEL